MNYWIHNNNTILPDYLQSTANVDFWIENADYYDIEGYYYFDSYDELFTMICDFKDELYNLRKSFIEKRREKALTKYKEAFLHI